MKQKIAELVRWLHLESGLNRTDFARCIGVSRYAVLRWEKGESMIPLDRFLSACEVAGVPPVTAVRRMYERPDG